MYKKSSWKFTRCRESVAKKKQMNLLISVQPYGMSIASSKFINSNRFCLIFVGAFGPYHFQKSFPFLLSIRISEKNCIFCRFAYLLFTRKVSCRKNELLNAKNEPTLCYRLFSVCFYLFFLYFE